MSSRNLQAASQASQAASLAYQLTAWPCVAQVVCKAKAAAAPGSSPDRLSRSVSMLGGAWAGVARKVEVALLGPGDLCGEPQCRF